jgi:hypothetical protein
VCTDHAVAREAHHPRTACVLQDLEHVDPEYHKSLMYILEHDVEEACPDTAFVTEVDFFGRKDIVELKPGGSSIMVWFSPNYTFSSSRLLLRV